MSVPKYKSICLLAHTFCLSDPAKFEDLHKEISSLPKSKNPLNLIDKHKYYTHVSRNEGILNIDTKNIYHFEIGSFEINSLEGIESLKEKFIYLDDEMKCELFFSSIKWIFVLDTKYKLGLLFYAFDLEIQSNNSLETLSKNKIFRYLRGPENKPDGPSNNTYKLKVFDKDEVIGYFSFYSLLKKCFGALCDNLNFLEAKPLQFHFLNKQQFDIPKDRYLHCYNLLRIPSNSKYEIVERSFNQRIGHVYESPSIYAYLMNEGLVIMAKDKPPKDLIKNYFATQIIFLYHRRFEHIVSSFMEKESDATNGISSSFIKKLKQIQKDFKFSNYFTNLPISQYSEIQEVYNLTKLNSGLNHDGLKVAFNEAAELIVDEAEEARADRERNIGIILGVVGLTGLISFIFDYLYISKNQKFLDILDFPFNTLPFFLFFLIFIIIYRYLIKY